MKLSQLAETLIGSEIVKLGNAINERIRQGEKIYNFTIGDFNPSIFPIPQKLEEEIIDAYKNHYTNYPPADGIPELRDAVSTFIKDGEGINYSSSEILIASGGRPLILTLFRTIVDRGDKVIYAVPSWNNNHYVHMTEGVHCKIDTTPENNFMPLAATLHRILKEQHWFACVLLKIPPEPPFPKKNWKKFATWCWKKTGDVGLMKRSVM